jgi:predicted PurR-regulated permease PerM
VYVRNVTVAGYLGRDAGKRPTRPRRSGAVLERVVRFRVRTVLAIVGLILVVWAVIRVISIARTVIVWFLIALFLALAINPLVEWLQHRGIRRRGVAVATAFAAVLGGLVLLAATFVPIVVRNVNNFADATPGYVEDITEGRGRLGFLQTRYHVVDRIREQINEGGAKKVLGLSGTALAITKSVLNIVVGIVTIAFMTLFMLLEGPRWIERLYGLLPPESRPRWEGVGRQVYRTVGGYVSGNLAISVIAGLLTTIVLLILGVPYAVALGLIVAILDLIPLAGATIAAIIITTVAFLHTAAAGIIVLVFFILYQQFENHVLQPLVYGRTVQISPLAVLLAVLIGAEIAGVIGALGAIPVAGTIQVLIVDYLKYRRERAGAPPALT